MLTKALGHRDEHSITLDEVRVTIPTICFLKRCVPRSCAHQWILRTFQDSKRTEESHNREVQETIHRTLEVQGQLNDG